MIKKKLQSTEYYRLTGRDVYSFVEFIKALNESNIEYIRRVKSVYDVNA